AKAKELLLTGDHISAAEAEKIGLVNKTVPTGNGVEEALAIAKIICKNSPAAMKNIKQAVDEGLDLPFQKALEREAELFQDLYLKKDIKVSKTTMIEKSKTIF